MFKEAKGIIYPSISKPIYLQLRDILVDMINVGELAPGDPLPGERTLAELYDISRVTVRKSIGALVDEGYLERSHGKETTVAHRRINHHLGRLVGSIEEFLGDQQQGFAIEVLQKSFQEGSLSARHHLKLTEKGKDPIYAFTRRIIQNGQPIAINFSFVPSDIGKLIDALDLTTARVFAFLESYGYNLAYGEQEISAAICSAEEAAMLQYEPGKAMLVIRRTSYLEDGYPLLYEKTIYRGDNYQYSIRLQRKL